MSLLDKAKEIHTGHSKSVTYTPDEMELAIAWAKGEVNSAQVCKVLKLKNGGVGIYTFMARALAQHVRTFHK